MKRLIWLLLGCVPVCGLQAAEEFTSTQTWLHLNGYSHHFAAPDAKSFLWGVGVTRYTRTYGPVLRSWEGDLFSDSGGKPSAYVGHTWTIPTRLLSFGATGALMYHRNFEEQIRCGVLPVVLPFAETRGQRLKFRIYYVPPVRRATDEQLAVQMMLPWSGGSYARHLP